MPHIEILTITSKFGALIKIKIIIELYICAYKCYHAKFVYEINVMNWFEFFITIGAWQGMLYIVR